MSPALTRTLPTAWRFALAGALASVPVTALLIWLPDADADFAGGIMTIGAFVAGALAVTCSTDPVAAGFRAGVLAGIIAIPAPLVAVDGFAVEFLPAWSTPIRFVLLAVVVLVLASMFGSVFGRIGGWVATIVSTVRSETSA